MLFLFLFSGTVSGIADAASSNNERSEVDMQVEAEGMKGNKLS